MSIPSGHYKWYQSLSLASIFSDFTDSPSSCSLPIFSGGDGSSWLRQCVSQFRLYDVPEKNQVYRAWMALAGEALHWFNEWQTGHDSLLWVEFCVAVLSRFPRPSSSSASATLPSSPCANSKGKGVSTEFLPSISLGPSPGIVSNTKKQLKQAGIISPRLKDWSQFHTILEVLGSLFSPPKLPILCKGCEFGTEFWGRGVKKWKSDSSFGFHSCHVCCCLHVCQGEGNNVCFKAPYKELGSAYRVFEESPVPCLDPCPFPVTASTCVKEVAATEQLVSALPGILVDTEMPVLLRAAVLAREKKATREEENQFAQQNCCYSGVYTENGWCSKLKEPYQESETKNSQIAYLRFKEPQGTEIAVQFDFCFGFKGTLGDYLLVMVQQLEDKLALRKGSYRQSSHGVGGQNGFMNLDDDIPRMLEDRMSIWEFIVEQMNDATPHFDETYWFLEGSLKTSNSHWSNFKLHFILSKAVTAVSFEFAACFCLVIDLRTSLIREVGRGW
ncbi:hypothetical protein LINPERHAP1_LOCUS33385 [Linum perenne]